MVEIPLTRGKVALVDDEDAHWAQFKWFARHRFGIWYAERAIHRRDLSRTFLLHRSVLGVEGLSVQVDHINGDGLDCRRTNLRVATPAENTRNRRVQRNNLTGYKGVGWHKRDKVWTARIRNECGRLVRLGTFRSPVDAARAYDDAARSMHGEFARVNFPRENEQPAAALRALLGGGDAQKENEHA